MKRIILLGFAILAMSNCQSTSTAPGSAGPKQTVGALSGAIIGGVIGNQIGDGQGKNISTALGIVSGVVIGAGIGQTLDRIDQQYMEDTQLQALEMAPTNTALDWNNPDTGNSGYTTPTNTYYQDNLPCREYTTVVTVAGEKQQAYGTACRMNDGSWKIQ
jgi:surface antigen